MERKKILFRLTVLEREGNDDCAGLEKLFVRWSHRSLALVMLAVPYITARLACCFTWDPAASCSPLAWDVSKKFL